MAAFLLYKPESVLMVSTHSFDLQVCGHTMEGGEKEKKAGCPGTRVGLLPLRTRGCESPREGG